MKERRQVIITVDSEIPERPEDLDANLRELAKVFDNNTEFEVVDIAITIEKEKENS